MSDKPFKEMTSFEKLLPRVIVGIVVAAFTLLGFVIKQPCDIDNIYLWCRLHPLSIGDIIGLIMFYGGSIFISGILPVKLYNPENTIRWNIAWFVLMILSIVLIWNT